MAHIDDKTIAQAVDLIINTRDFCGNEMESIQDFCADENIKDWHKVWRIANFRANAQWNEYKKQAGVNPKYCF
jgi:hypothetical protein